MMPNYLFILASDLPLEWSTDYSFQTAKAISKNSIVILWHLQSISLKEYIMRREMPSLLKSYSNTMYIYQTIYFFPFKRFAFIRRLNDYVSVCLLKIIILYLQYTRHIKKSILWVFDPQFTSLYQFFSNTTQMIYDCVDYFPGIALTQKMRMRIVEEEHYLFRRANVVTVNSHILKKLHEKQRSDIHIVPQGFRYDSFKRSPWRAPFVIPHNKPVIGYIGAINYRLDLELLKQVIRNNKDCVFVFVGPIVKDVKEHIVRKKYFSLRRYKNVYIYPNVEKQYIPGVVSQFDICMIPYDITFDFNRYCHPMKLFEYFYVGKPVISTPIEELKRFPTYIKIARTPEEWKKQIKTLLIKSWPKKYQKDERKLAIANSWERKIKAILKLIHD